MSKLIAYEDLTPKQIAEYAQQNHIWLNAFMCINPSDKFKIELADTVLRMLEESKVRATKLSNGQEPISNEVILRINKS